ncbi:MAG: endo-1,4-beta-xylanase [Patescibacteria group bacterium]|nr:endo-1,4-beta-xylanase [Patescibacteria group bacterium]
MNYKGIIIEESLEKDLIMNTPLKDLAIKKGIYIGAAINVEKLVSDEKYKRLVKKEFNMVTPENAMKWFNTHPVKDRFTFDQADLFMDFAKENNLAVHAHVLVWHKHLPDWLTKVNFSKDELWDILKEHIFTVVRRYKGQIYAWDVVNEALNYDGLDPNSFWLQNLGQEFIAKSFQWTHEADPNAKLFYNEWGVEGLDEKSDHMYELVKNLLSKGVPMHGIGFQMHVGTEDSENCGKAPSKEDIAANMKRFSDLGLEIHITEMDVQISQAQGTRDEKLKKQAEIYKYVLEAAFSVPNFKALNTWGVIDKYSWIKAFYSEDDEPLLFDDNYQPKPAYYSLVEALQ